VTRSEADQPDGPVVGDRPDVPESGASESGAVVAVGIDVGSSNVKVSLISAGVRVEELAVCTAPTPPDADGLVRVVLDLLRSVLVTSSERPIAIGIASMAESGVPLGDDLRPLSPIIRWDGADESTDLDQLVEGFGAAELFARTGVPALPKAPLVLWAGLRRRRPELFAAMTRWAGVADLVALALTDVLATDHTLAGRTMAYDLPAAGASGAFARDLLAAVGLRSDQLPEVREPGEPVGPVTAAVAGRVGLPAGIPVFVAGHDHLVGAWAAGARSVGDAADSIGTAEAVLRVTAHPDPEPVRATGMSLIRTVDGGPALLAGSSSAGSFAKWWFAQRLGAAEPAAVLAAVAELPAGPTGVTVLPYLAGRQSPRPDRRAATRVLDADGRDLDTGRVDIAVLTKAMLEGLALHARWMLEVQDELAGPAAGPIRILGGPGGGNRPWMRVKAQVFGVPSELTTASEPVATAAALLAAARALRWSAPPTLPAVKLDRQSDDLYSEAFERFVTAASAAPGARRTEGER
jgi:xylulokinase